MIAWADVRGIRVACLHLRGWPTAWLISANGGLVL